MASVRRDQAQWLVSRGVSRSKSLTRLFNMTMGPTGSLSLLLLLSSAASLLSGTALVVTLAGVNWVAVSGVSLAILAVLGIIRGVSRALAYSQGERIALGVAPPVRAIALMLQPVLAVEILLSRMVLGLTGGPSSAAGGISDELGLSFDSDGEPLGEREVRMIKGVVRLDKTIAREIMVPRVDVVAAESGVTLAELAELMVAVGGHSRIPVYRGGLDHVVGIAHARDVLRILSETNGAPTGGIESVARPPLFIPESKSLEELLNEFQQVRVHMAIVVDEYGGVSGLVTIEDLLEEIVGEIRDEFDIAEPEVEPVGENHFTMDARVSIEEVNELLSVSVEGEGFDTLGGFVYQQLGKIPSPGDRVEYDGIRIEVISTVGRRLKRLRVVKAGD